MNMKKTLPSLAEKVGWFYLVLATGGLSGFFPIAPGTAGTAVAIPLYVLFVYAGWLPYLIGMGVLFWLGVEGANRIEKATQQKDGRLIVIDEIVGYLVTMLFLPVRWELIIAGFFVFRFFDILKPYPIRKLDMNPNLKGFGVMIDDVLAGVYSCIVLWIAAMIFHL